MGDCPNFRGHHPGTIDRWSAKMGLSPLLRFRNTSKSTKILTGPKMGKERIRKKIWGIRPSPSPF
jgi:hypothetical protein